MSIDKKKLNKITDKIMPYKPEKKIAKPICEGSLVIGDIVIPCAVLEGGIRVLSERSITTAIGRKKRMKREIEKDGTQLPAFLSPNNLKPFINNDITVPSNYIDYQPKTGGRTAYGIKADILPMICEVFINAKNARVLKKNQLPIADRCRILQNGLARVGVMALVDEATGYQDVRAKNALAKILEHYLTDEAKKWTQTFPLEFYQQIYRLKKWNWLDLENGKKPQTPSVVGRYTDDFVYKRITPGLLEELRNKNPDRRVRHHQWFNPDRGHPKLIAHITGVIAVMKLSYDWKDYENKIKITFPLQWQEGTLFYKPDNA